MKSKYLILFLIAIATVGLTQNPTKKSIDKEVRRIDNLRIAEKIDSVQYQDRSICGGAIQGFYSSSNLVIIESHFAVELYFSRLKVYQYKNTLLKIEYEKSFPNWDKYELDFPSDSSNELDEISTLIESVDTMYILYFTKPIEMKTYSKSILVSTELDLKIFEGVMECAEHMKSELEGQKND